MKPAGIESMTFIEDDRLQARVWRTELNVCDAYENDDIKDMFGLMVCSPQSNSRAVALVLLGMERVTAVEVLYKHSKCGLVLYKEWP